MKRREVKDKGEKERLQSSKEQQGEIRKPSSAIKEIENKEIEENNRMGKTGDLFKKFRDTKGTFHAKMGLIKKRNAKKQNGCRGRPYKQL